MFNTVSNTSQRVWPARLANKRTAIALLLGLSAGFVGCTSNVSASEKPRKATAGASAGDTAGPVVLATIGDEKITMADIHGRAGETMDMLDGQYVRMRDKLVGSTLDSLLRERLIGAEAQKRGKTPDELILAEAGGTFQPTEIEISSWYKDNQSRVGGRTLEQVRSQINDLLTKQHRTDAIDKLDQRLRAERKVTVNFEPHRPQFANAGAPTVGKTDSPITLVEFSDFQCPYCQATAPVLKALEQKYGDKVQIIYRQFPLSIHPFAFKAAEASLCANEQGKFWPMHDEMFGDQTKLAVSDLKQTARRLGMDGKKFDGCLDSGKYVEQVQNDQKEGMRIGVNGTPAMFINGAYVEGGSVPFPVLESLIKRELLRVKAGA